MPLAPFKPCSRTGCKILTRDRFCTDHKKSEQLRYNRERGSAVSRGYDSKWRTERLGFLSKHPLCICCQQKGLIVAATVVDHIKPHKGDKALFWDRNNWQPMCKSDHDAKTVREDGGFGKYIK
ncbi:HNH endonuclease signature motif containing protein [Paenibacillus sepulcri]|uniref:Putative HNH nuclease YajD n=1 Tax=Paenibacillus sepulcri TaxID=359917 RepID=A0ABS7BUX9_9BACL|nr:HNH endonuclease [Paenibacillus sepulcri]